MKLIPCRLSQMLIEERTDSQIIFLNEIDGQRKIPIMIGPLEALAIDRAIKKQSFPRPLTHDLIVELLKQTKSACIAVRITEIREGTFYAALVIKDQDGNEHLMDCRPSDAIALLVRLDNVPLYVSEDVLNEAP